MPANEKSKKSFWPYGILISIALIIAACVATVIFSLDYPVYRDAYYLDTYQKVDENYNEIQLKQEKFEKNYEVKFEVQSEPLGENVSVSLPIKAKNNGELSKIKAEILITRPDSAEFDKKLVASLKDGALKSEEFGLERLGRWQVMAKISDSNDVGFYKFEFNATKEPSGLYKLQILERNDS